MPSPLKTSLFMWGPGLAALIVLAFSKRSSTPLTRYKLFENGVVANLTVYLIPSLLFIVMFSSVLTMQQIIFFLTLFNLVMFFNTLGEELGWRGFLQANLSALSSFKRYLAIGILWELWHLPMRLGAISNGAAVENMLMLSAGTLVLSFVMGFFVERTKSVTIAVCLHAYMNSMMSLSHIANIPQQDLIPYFAIVGMFYIVVLFSWHTNKFNWLNAKKEKTTVQ